MDDIQGRSCGGQGLILMEVLVSVAILAMGLTAVLKGSGENQDALITSREMTVAGMLGRNMMERIASAGLENWTETEGFFEEPFTRYAWEFENETTDTEGLEKGILTIILADNHVPVLKLERLFLKKGT